MADTTTGSLAATTESNISWQQKNEKLKKILLEATRDKSGLPSSLPQALELIKEIPSGDFKIPQTCLNHLSKILLNGEGKKLALELTSEVINKTAKIDNHSTMTNIVEALLNVGGYDAKVLENISQILEKFVTKTPTRNLEKWSIKLDLNPDDPKTAKAIIADLSETKLSDDDNELLNNISKNLEASATKELSMKDLKWLLFKAQKENDRDAKILKDVKLKKLFIEVWKENDLDIRSLKEIFFQLTKQNNSTELRSYLSKELKQKGLTESENQKATELVNLFIDPPKKEKKPVKKSQQQFKELLSELENSSNKSESEVEELLQTITSRIKESPSVALNLPLEHNLFEKNQGILGFLIKLNPEGKYASCKSDHFNFLCNIVNSYEKKITYGNSNAIYYDAALNKIKDIIKLDTPAKPSKTTLSLFTLYQKDPKHAVFLADGIIASLVKLCDNEKEDSSEFLTNVMNNCDKGSEYYQQAATIKNSRLANDLNSVFLGSNKSKSKSKIKIKDKDTKQSILTTITEIKDNKKVSADKLKELLTGIFPETEFRNYYYYLLGKSAFNKDLVAFSDRSKIKSGNNQVSTAKFDTSTMIDKLDKFLTHPENSSQDAKLIKKAQALVEKIDDSDFLKTTLKKIDLLEVVETEHFKLILEILDLADESGVFNKDLINNFALNISNKCKERSGNYIVRLVKLSKAIGSHVVPSNSLPENHVKIIVEILKKYAESERPINDDNDNDFFTKLLHFLQISITRKGYKSCLLNIIKSPNTTAKTRKDLVDKTLDLKDFNKGDFKSLKEILKGTQDYAEFLNKIINNENLSKESHTDILLEILPDAADLIDNNKSPITDKILPPMLRKILRDIRRGAGKNLQNITREEKQNFKEAHTKALNSLINRISELGAKPPESNNEDRINTLNSYLETLTSVIGETEGLTKDNIPAKTLLKPLTDLLNQENKEIRDHADHAISRICDCYDNIPYDQTSKILADLTTKRISSGFSHSCIISIIEKTKDIPLKDLVQLFQNLSESFNETENYYKTEGLAKNNYAFKSDVINSHRTTLATLNLLLDQIISKEDEQEIKKCNEIFQTNVKERLQFKDNSIDFFIHVALERDFNPKLNIEDHISLTINEISHNALIEKFKEKDDKSPNKLSPFAYKLLLIDHVTINNALKKYWPTLKYQRSATDLLSEEINSDPPDFMGNSILLICEEHPDSFEPSTIKGTDKLIKEVAKTHSGKSDPFGIGKEKLIKYTEFLKNLKKKILNNNQTTPKPPKITQKNDTATEQVNLFIDPAKGKEKTFKKLLSELENSSNKSESEVEELLQTITSRIEESPSEALNLSLKHNLFEKNQEILGFLIKLNPEGKYASCKSDHFNFLCNIVNSYKKETTYDDSNATYYDAALNKIKKSIEPDTPPAKPSKTTLSLFTLYQKDPKHAVFLADGIIASLVKLCDNEKEDSSEFLTNVMNNCDKGSEYYQQAAAIKNSRLANDLNSVFSGSNKSKSKIEIKDKDTKQSILTTITEIKDNKEVPAHKLKELLAGIFPEVKFRDYHYDLLGKSIMPNTLVAFSDQSKIKSGNNQISTAEFDTSEMIDKLDNFLTHPENSSQDAKLIKKVQALVKKTDDSDFLKTTLKKINLLEVVETERLKRILEILDLADESGVFNKDLIKNFALNISNKCKEPSKNHTVRLVKLSKAIGSHVVPSNSLPENHVKIIVEILKKYAESERSINDANDNDFFTKLLFLQISTASKQYKSCLLDTIKKPNTSDKTRKHLVDKTLSLKDFNKGDFKSLKEILKGTQDYAEFLNKIINNENLSKESHTDILLEILSTEGSNKNLCVEVLTKIFAGRSGEELPTKFESLLNICQNTPQQEVAYIIRDFMMNQMTPSSHPSILKWANENKDPHDENKYITSLSILANSRILTDQISLLSDAADLIDNNKSPITDKSLPPMLKKILGDVGNGAGQNLQNITSKEEKQNVKKAHTKALNSLINRISELRANLLESNNEDRINTLNSYLETLNLLQHQITSKGDEQEIKECNEIFLNKTKELLQFDNNPNPSYAPIDPVKEKKKTFKELLSELENPSNKSEVEELLKTITSRIKESPSVALNLPPKHPLFVKNQKILKSLIKLNPEGKYASCKSDHFNFLCNIVNSYEKETTYNNSNATYYNAALNKIKKSIEPDTPAKPSKTTLSLFTLYQKDPKHAVFLEDGIIDSLVQLCDNEKEDSSEFLANVMNNCDEGSEHYRQAATIKNSRLANDLNSVFLGSNKSKSKSKIKIKDKDTKQSILTTITEIKDNKKVSADKLKELLTGILPETKFRDYHYAILDELNHIPGVLLAFCDRSKINSANHASIAKIDTSKVPEKLGKFLTSPKNSSQDKELIQKVQDLVKKIDDSDFLKTTLRNINLAKAVDKEHLKLILEILDLADESGDFKKDLIKKFILETLTKYGRNPQNNTSIALGEYFVPKISISENHVKIIVEILRKYAESEGPINDNDDNDFFTRLKFSLDSNTTSKQYKSCLFSIIKSPNTPAKTRKDLVDKTLDLKDFNKGDFKSLKEILKGTQDYAEFLNKIINNENLSKESHTDILLEILSTEGSNKNLCMKILMKIFAGRSGEKLPTKFESLLNICQNTPQQEVAYIIRYFMMIQMTPSSHPSILKWANENKDPNDENKYITSLSILANNIILTDQISLLSDAADLIDNNKSPITDKSLPPMLKKILGDVGNEAGQNLQNITSKEEKQNFKKAHTKALNSLIKRISELGANPPESNNEDRINTLNSYLETLTSVIGETIELTKDNIPAKTLLEPLIGLVNQENQEIRYHADKAITQIYSCYDNIPYDLTSKILEDLTTKRISSGFSHDCIISIIKKTKDIPLKDLVKLFQNLSESFNETENYYKPEKLAKNIYDFKSDVINSHRTTLVTLNLLLDQIISKEDEQEIKKCNEIFQTNVKERLQFNDNSIDFFLEVALERNRNRCHQFYFEDDISHTINEILHNALIEKFKEKDDKSPNKLSPFAHKLALIYDNQIHDVLTKYWPTLKYQGSATDLLSEELNSGGHPGKSLVKFYEKYPDSFKPSTLKDTDKLIKKVNEEYDAIKGADKFGIHKGTRTKYTKFLNNLKEKILNNNQTTPSTAPKSPKITQKNDKSRNA